MVIVVAWLTIGTHFPEIGSLDHALRLEADDGGVGERVSANAIRLSSAQLSTLKSFLPVLVSAVVPGKRAGQSLVP
jgi:hypothetical protein